MTQTTPSLSIVDNLGTTNVAPPDPMIAVGMSGIVTTDNATVSWFDGQGNLVGQEASYNFFLPVGGAGGDMRVVYDRFNDRFVVMSLANGTTGNADMPIAVSKDGNPADGWYFGTVDVGSAALLDYPAVVATGNAIEVQANEFSTSGTYVASDLFSIPTGLGVGGFYDGGPLAKPTELTSTVTGTAIGEPVEPEGTAAASNVIYLYDGAGFGTQAFGGVYYGDAYFEKVVGTTVTQEMVSFTGFPAENYSSFPYPTQPGTTTTITTELGENAVLAGGFIYAVQPYVPASGPDAGVLTTHWMKVDPTNWTIVDQGDVSGATLGAGVATFDATIAADTSGDFAISFTASGPSLYAGSYYVLHRATDPPGSVEAPGTLHVGVAPFDVTSITGGRNRWGDYERTVMPDPHASDTFWLFDQYAATPTASGVGVSGETLGQFTGSSACYCSGTRIATARGRVAVEALREGDLVITAGGRLAPIRWLGHRRTSLRQHPRPFDVMPVRVLAGAFGEGLPCRDLVLSPDHAVFVDGYLVPVRYLVNGQSIVQEMREAITYWHVEVDRHDVILAEGLSCETYLDTGNRDAFENDAGAMALHPEFSPQDFARQVWKEHGCAPILVDPAEPTLRALHTRVLAAATRAPRQSGRSSAAWTAFERVASA